MKNSTAEELRQLMVEHDYSRAEIADMASVSPKTVEAWLASPSAASHRPMHLRYLKLIKLEIGSRRRRRKSK